ncbi:MAG: GntR family transcriptional regulator [Nocardioidaceae bacterium]|nr:GntR family transcriptional regulator [Nocardioidaceae bacterium]
MLLRVDPDSSTGLADQIASQVRGALMSGRLQPGEKLPAARELAARLDVNMHTVLRAYSALRDEGLIELRRGRGAQVRSDVNLRRAEFEQQVKELIDAANHLGLSRDELIHHIDKVTT